MPYPVQMRFRVCRPIVGRGRFPASWRRPTAYAARTCAPTPRAGLDQETFADCSASPPYIGSVERGERNLSRRKLVGWHPLTSSPMDRSSRSNRPRRFAHHWQASQYSERSRTLFGLGIQVVGDQSNVERLGHISAPALRLSTRLAKPLANTGRNRILMALHYLRPMSATQFTHAFNEPELASVARHLRELEEWGFIEL